MRRWTRYSFSVFVKIFILCFAAALTLTLCFDLSLEFDHWSESSAVEMGYKILSMGLILTPVCLWVAVLLCIIRWQRSKELILIETYQRSWFDSCKGLGLGLVLIILVWFLLRETLWIKGVNQFYTNKAQSILFHLNDDPILLKRAADDDKISLWIDHGAENFFYPEIKLHPQRGWQLIEDLRMPRSPSSRRIESRLNELFPNQLHLDWSFKAKNYFNLLELFKLQKFEAMLCLIYRCLTPIWSVIFIYGSIMTIVRAKGKTFWRCWSLSFSAFILCAAILEACFNS